jgi:hypothetical protein
MDLIIYENGVRITGLLDFARRPELRTMDKVRKPSDSECCTPSSEPFRIYTQMELKDNFGGNEQVLRIGTSGGIFWTRW